MVTNGLYPPLFEEERGKKGVSQINFSPKLRDLYDKAVINMSLRGTEPRLAPWIIRIVTCGQTCHSDPALAGEESPQNQQRT